MLYIDLGDDDASSSTINIRSGDDALTFNVVTYKQFTKSGELTWVQFFQLINQYFASLTVDDQLTVFNMYRFASERLTLVDETNYKVVATEVGDRICDTLLKLNTIGQFYELAQHIPIPDLSGVGARAHDRPEYTFRESDYIQLTGLSLICKMLSPIWGEFIHRIRDHIGDTTKEVACREMIEPLLASYYVSPIYSKLSEYTSNQVRQLLRTRRRYHGNNARYQVEFTLASSGLTIERLIEVIISTLVVKKFVTFDALKPEANIMKYIYTGITGTFDARISAKTTTSQMLIRTDPPERASSDGHNTVSLTEHQSVVSDDTADIPVLVRFAVDQAVATIRQTLSVPDALFDAMMRYYTNNFDHSQINVFSTALLSTAFGRMIGGARGFKYITMVQHLQLTSLLQIQLSQQGYHQLKSLLSAITPSSRKQTAIDVVDDRIDRNVFVTAEYRALKMVFPYTVAGVTIDQKISAIKEWVIGYEHYLNMPSAIYDYEQIPNDARPAPRAIVCYDERVMQEFCQFLGNHYILPIAS